MERDIFLLIMVVLTLVSSITSIIVAIKDTRIGRNATAFITLIVTLVVLYVYINRDKIFVTPLPPPTVTEPIAISGSYTGYFIDKLGSEIPTYLEISLDSINDSIRFVFKNDFTSICYGVYDISSCEVTIHKLGHAKVSEDKGKVTIESTGNIENKWKFIKDRRVY
jgi:hypothetical protein